MVHSSNYQVYRMIECAAKHPAEILSHWCCCRGKLRCKAASGWMDVCDISKALQFLSVFRVWV